MLKIFVLFVPFREGFIAFENWILVISAHGNISGVFLLLQEVSLLFRCALQDTFLMLKIEISLLKIKKWSG